MIITSVWCMERLAGVLVVLLLRLASLPADAQRGSLFLPGAAASPMRALSSRLILGVHRDACGGHGSLRLVNGQVCLELSC